MDNTEGDFCQDLDGGKMTEREFAGQFVSGPLLLRFSSSGMTLSGEGKGTGCWIT